MRLRLYRNDTASFFHVLEEVYEKIMTVKIQ
jgi:hypothetical protein